MKNLFALFIGFVLMLSAFSLGLAEDAQLSGGSLNCWMNIIQSMKRMRWMKPRR